jgi:putative LysE/RhtB family amino acid efflux pump
MNLSIPLFVKAIGLGFATAAPVGPIGLLCISQTLRHNFRAGIAVGLGAACADALYGFLAASWLGLIAHFLSQFKIILQLFGGSLLVYLGYRELMYVKIRQVTPTVSGHFFGSIFATSFLLTLTNPMTLLFFLGIFSFLDDTVPSYARAGLMIGGIFTGSMIWWTILTLLVSLTRTKIPLIWLTRIQRLSGILLICFGLFILGATGSTLLYRLNNRHRQQGINLLRTASL